MVNASTDDIAVIQTRLPYTDRRALSEAWFSALHVASENAGGEGKRASAPPPGEASSGASFRMRQKDVSEGKKIGEPMVWRTPPSPRREEGCGAVSASERARVRRPCAPAALSEEPSGEKLSHVHFTMTVAGARVALHVRRDGGKVVVIAVCSARHVELVRRALAEAAIGMGLQGERVDTAVRALDGEDRL